MIFCDSANKRHRNHSSSDLCHSRHYFKYLQYPVSVLMHKGESVSFKAVFDDMLFMGRKVLNWKEKILKNKIGERIYPNLFSLQGGCTPLQINNLQKYTRLLMCIRDKAVFLRLRRGYKALFIPTLTPSISLSLFISFAIPSKLH